jgi:eukaryotic-like serine/threonine-protein kinase
MSARGLRARILLARGCAAEAAREAEETVALCRNAGIYDYFRFSATLLTRAEANHAAGHIDAAKEAIRDARDDLLARAEKIEDPKYRQSFLSRVPVHVRTLALAREWLAEES